MSGSVGGLASIFWENSEIVDKLQSFQGVGQFFSRAVRILTIRSFGDTDSLRSLGRKIGLCV